MPAFERSAVINRPIEEVFAFATNPEHAPRWLPDVRRIEMLTPGPLRAGSKFNETRLMKGKEHSAVIEVGVHEPPHRHAASATMMGVTATYHYSFARDGGGTKVHLVAEVAGRGLGKLLVPMVVGTMKKQDGDQLDRLKAVIEGGRP